MSEVKFIQNDQTLNDYLIRKTLSNEIKRVTEEVREKIEHLEYMTKMYKQYDMAIQKRNPSLNKIKQKSEVR